jgi:opacity protein-like surface antigen
MKHLRFTLTLIAALSLLALLAAPLSTVARAQDPQTQNQATAIMRGYRTGYSDGYQAGFRDSSAKAARDFRSKEEYDRGDRAYASTYGSLEEYRDGYQQGFEVGYDAGYDRKTFDSSMPPNLNRRTEDSTVQYPTDQNKTPAVQPQTQPVSAMAIPRDTIMRVELLGNLSTEATQKGDPFQVRVIEPKEFEGATIEGTVTRVKRPGRVKSNAELQLSFEQIRLPDGRSSKMSAQIIEVISMSGSQGVGKVDSEGGVQGRDSTKGDVQKVGAAAGIGAVIGAIAGGGVGAAVGATIGAGVGTAGVLSERGRDIHLYQGQQLRIRTAGDAEFQ